MASTGERGLSTLRSTQTRFSSSGWHQQFFFSSTGPVDVDSREDTLVHQAAIEVDFHVAGALEFLEDHVVHAAAGVNEGRGNDCERATLLDVSRGGENRRGRCKAFASIPPERTLPEGGV